MRELIAIHVAGCLYQAAGRIAARCRDSIFSCARTPTGPTQSWMVPMRALTSASVVQASINSFQFPGGGFGSIAQHYFLNTPQIKTRGSSGFSIGVFHVRLAGSSTAKCPAAKTFLFSASLFSSSLAVRRITSFAASMSGKIGRRISAKTAKVSSLPITSNSKLPTNDIVGRLQPCRRERKVPSRRECSAVKRVFTPGQST
jgi:hypothetical protein